MSPHMYSSKFPHHNSHPYPLFCHHLTPSRARMRRERAPPPNGTPSTSALNAGNHPICVLKTLEESGGALPVVVAAPALAESTAGVEPAGEAERAATARPEALASWTQGEAGREVETPPGGGEQELKALPPEGERKLDAMPQRNPNEGECDPDLLPREVACEAQRQSGRKLDVPSRVDPKGVAERMHEALPLKVDPTLEALPRKGDREHAKALPPEGEGERGTTP